MNTRPPPAPERVALGEDSVTKVVGHYAGAEAARAARERVAAAGITAVALRPQDARHARRDMLSRSFEPESRGIWHTIVRAHLLAGSIGFAAGLCIWAVLRAWGWPMIVSSPGLSGLFIVFFTTSLGLIAGGLVALRPDHSAVYNDLRSSLRQGGHAVVAHPTDAAGVETSERLLKEGSTRVVRTL